MQKIIDNVKANDRIIFALIFILAIPAFLIHLGYMPVMFGTDEPRRALVALEMLISKDYITPTLNGELYFNKPPLYNWIILAFYKITGNTSSLVLRLPMILALAGFSFTIFYFLRKHFDRLFSLLVVGMVLTCGRILFYDSMLGLIDICFSLIAFTMFMMVYHYAKKEKYWHLFLLTYMLTALGFLMKGLPAVVFLGITYLTYFISEKKFKKLFLPQHFVGIALFIIIIGSYYWAYNLKHPDSLSTIASTIFNESSKRTVASFGIWPTILHLFTFPFEAIYHFLPWSLGILLCIRKGFFKDLNANPFVKYCALIFIFNILIYWSSVEVYARYLIMFCPLIFTVFAYNFKCLEEKNQWKLKTLEWIFVVASFILLLSFIAIPFIDSLRSLGIPYFYVKVIILIGMAVAIIYLMLKIPVKRMIFFVLILLVARIGFDWFILPHRLKDSGFDVLHKNLVEIGEMTKGHTLLLTRNANFRDAETFYIEDTRREMLRVVEKIEDYNAFYIAGQDDLVGKNYRIIKEFHVECTKLKAFLVKFEKKTP